MTVTRPFPLDVYHYEPLTADEGGMTTPPPLVHRSVRYGAWFIFVGAVQFVIANILVQLYFPNYSLWTNYISDLGNTVKSPEYLVFNISIILLGLFAFVGILLAWSAFPRGGLRVTGLSLLLLASVGAIFVGLFPENVNGTIHSIASLLVFLPSGIALLALGPSMNDQNHWGTAMRWFLIALGVIILVSLALFLFTTVGSATYPGLFERLVVYPVLLWAIVVGVFLARIPIRARRHLVPGV